MNKIKMSVFILLVCSGCNYIDSNSVESKVDNNIKGVTDSLRINYLKSKDKLSITYKTTSKEIIDTSLSKKIDKYVIKVFATVAYIDSLKSKLNSLHDVNSKRNAVDDFFNGSDLDDILFRKIDSTYNLAQNIAYNKRKMEIIKSRKNILFDSDFRKLSNFYFASRSSDAVIWNLFAFETEILNVGTNCLKDFSH